ncbi:hypothetical protein [Pseudarthrobacter sp. MEB009]|uniref:hypothetical protein n=1 Tax=Pseudarthrobacter sp. MEB009 TaxID=3040326 RepID=UPI001910753B|nr:hypothetical protein [Pseudarthrobacter sp. MEB009]
MELVGHLLDNNDEAIRQWFGAGMLQNVVTTLGLAAIDKPWARAMSGTCATAPL